MSLWPPPRSWQTATREHMAIKKIGKEISDLVDTDQNTAIALLRSLDDFIRLVHGKVEDEVYFPAASEAARRCMKSPDMITGNIPRLEADHLMISKLCSSILTGRNRFGPDTLKERVQGYVRILMDHQRSEEDIAHKLLSECKDAWTSEIQRRGVTFDTIYNKFGQRAYLDFMNV